MVVCFLDGLYLERNLAPAHPAVRLVTRLLLYFITYYFYYAYTTLMRGGKLVLSGLWGECCVCDLGVWRERVVSTKLEYTRSLRKVLPRGATWAPVETDTYGG